MNRIERHELYEINKGRIVLLFLLLIALATWKGEAFANHESVDFLKDKFVMEDANGQPVVGQLYLNKDGKVAGNGEALHGVASYMMVGRPDVSDRFWLVLFTGRHTVVRIIEYIKATDVQTIVWDIKWKGT